MELFKPESSLISRLTKISKEAFDTDICVGGAKNGGPPNYDSEKWHKELLKQDCLYALIDNNTIVGGLIVFEDKEDNTSMHLGRIFIDPINHRKGYGTNAISIMERKWNKVKKWKLETPIWNKRTSAFYIKNGYREIKRDEESIYFIKEIWFNSQKVGSVHLTAEN